jgi:hypothetical protein
LDEPRSRPTEAKSKEKKISKLEKAEEVTLLSENTISVSSFECKDSYHGF